jgi:hypothetical protein
LTVCWQRGIVSASGVFCRPHSVHLGAATPAQYYGWQRSIIKHIAGLQTEEQVLLEGALASAGEGVAQGDPVGFARELSTYLAHCQASSRQIRREPPGAGDGADARRAVRLLAVAWHRGFFRALNAILMDQAAQRVMNESAPEDGFGEVDGSDDDDVYGMAYMEYDDDDDDDGLARVRYAMSMDMA